MEDNSNYKFDRPEELIAFEASSFSVPDSTGHYLRIFKNISTELKIQKSSSTGLGKHVIAFNKPIKPELVNITCLEQEINFRKDFSTRNDSLTLWWKD